MSADPSSSGPGEQGENTAKAVEILASYESEDPRVAEFAHFIAERLNGHPSLIAPGFVLVSQLALHDLRMGMDGFTNQPIESKLVGISDGEVDSLNVAIPEMARTAFGKEFGERVEKRLIETGIIAPKKPEAEDYLTENEIITEQIDNIDDAYEKIIDDAKTRIMALDWGHFGIDKDEIGKEFEALAPIILRQAIYRLPITVLVDDPEYEKGLLLEMLPSQKRHMNDNYWWGLTRDRIPGDLATFTRDHLFLQGTEVLVGLRKLAKEEALMYLGGDLSSMSNPVVRAAMRMNTYMQDHPELFVSI